MRIFLAPQLDSQLRRSLYEGKFDAYVYFSNTSKETFEDKVKRMLREEVRQMMAAN